MRSQPVSVPYLVPSRHSVLAVLASTVVLAATAATAAAIPAMVSLLAAC
jgi:hypothetical protein